LLAAHVDDAEICIPSSGLGIQLKDGAESVLGFVQLAVGESVLPTLKKRCGIVADGIGRRSWRRERAVIGSRGRRDLRRRNRSRGCDKLKQNKTYRCDSHA